MRTPTVRHVYGDPSKHGYELERRCYGWRFAYWYLSVLAMLSAARPMSIRPDVCASKLTGWHGVALVELFPGASATTEDDVASDSGTNQPTAFVLPADSKGPAVGQSSYQP